MASKEVQLLGVWPSPFVNRVQLALKVKAVDYELIEENPHNKSERLIKANPVHKKIPVLIHDNKSICESLVIVQYIDDAWSNRPCFLPSDPYDRAMARFWATYTDEKIREAQGDEEARTEVIEKIYEAMALLEEAFVSCSKGKSFFGGDTLGYLDIILGSYLGWLGVTETLNGSKFIDQEKTPHLAEWAQRFRSNDVVKDLMHETPVLLELLKKFQAMKETN